MTELEIANIKAIGMLEARATVLGTFSNVVLPTSRCCSKVEVARSFRHGVEDAMALWTTWRCPRLITRRCWN
jgi:hypothetical protein